MSDISAPGDSPGRAPGVFDLDLLGTGPDERFDRLTRLARHLFDTPIALLSLTGTDRKWVETRLGIDPSRPPPEASFCAQMTIGDDLLVVPDATRDERFRDHPMVTNLPEIRFFAGCPVKGPDGKSLGTLAVIDHEPRDIAPEEAGVLKDLAWMLEQELKSLSLATLDELTGLTNRRGFDAIAEHTIAMCRRVDEPATLLYFDLDEFKRVNDTLGHAAGDRVLRSFAHHLKTTFRDSDVVARMGGDEFCVLLTSATTHDVERPLSLLAGRLRTRGGEPAVGFSVGVASYDPARHRTVQALVDEADLQMYRHKRDGVRRHLDE